MVQVIVRHLGDEVMHSQKARASTHGWNKQDEVRQSLRQASQRGFTVIELIMVIVLMGVIGGMVAVFMKSPIDAYVAGGRRAALTDVADTVVRRMARDIQRSLPNSIRSAQDTCLEFIPTKTGGRYRETDLSSSVGTALDFTTADSAFNMLGINSALPADQRIAVGDVVAIFNLGLAGADAYNLDNTSAVTDVSGEAAGETTLVIDSKHFPFESPSKRFHVISPYAQAVVSYVCANLGNSGLGDCKNALCLYRQPLSLTTAYAAPSNCQVPPADTPVMAAKLSACQFDYSGPDLQRNALVSMTLALTDSDETVRLLHQVHVSNEP
jgi:MSHA biogenesis protein MshO